MNRLNIFQSMLEVCPDGCVCINPSLLLTMMTWDTGAFFELTFCWDDFNEYVNINIPVKDVTKVNKFGIGIAFLNSK